jgi:hypothetical protein
MLLALTALLLTPAQATAAATPAEEAPAAAQAVAKEETARNSFSLAARPIRPVVPPRREERVAYLPGQLELHPVISESRAGTESASLTVTPAPKPPAAPLLERPRMTPAQRRVWIGLAVASHIAAGFDAWSTRRAISRGVGEELNPTLKSFANSGALYAVTQASPALMDYIGYRMARSQNRWVRRMWWLPQTAGMTVSLTAGIHNTRLVQ